MPFKLIAPSDGVAAVYRASLSDLVPGLAERAEHRHLPAWTLGMQHAAAGGPLDHAASGGCRFYAVAGPAEAYSCEMTDPGMYGNAAFRNLVEGEIPLKFVALMDRPPDLADFRTRTYEVHLLSISGLFLEAIWLRAEGEGEDYLLPVVSFYPELMTQPAFKASEFLAVIRPLAAQRLSASARSKSNEARRPGG